MQRYKAIQCHDKKVYGSANQNQLFVPDGRKAVNGSANQNPSNSFMKSELNIMHGERRGMHVIRHNTNEPKTGKKPGYMPSGLAFPTDVYHRNNRKDSNEATLIYMGMERGRMLKEPDNQSSGKATAKINRKTAAAASTFRRAVGAHW